MCGRDSAVLARQYRQPDAAGLRRVARRRLSCRGRWDLRRGFSHDEDLCSHTRRPPARLVRRRCRGPDPGPAGDPDRRRPARQAQARVHAARRHRRLHRRHQRREDPRHRRQAGAEALLAPQRLPGRDQVPHPGRDARPPPRGGDPQGGQGDASAQPPRPPAADQAEGLRRPGSPARGAAAANRWRSRLDQTTRPETRRTRRRGLQEAPAARSCREEDASSSQAAERGAHRHATRGRGV